MLNGTWQGKRTIPARAERMLYFLAVLVNAVPIWLTEFPPFVDIPQHASQVATFLRLSDPTYPLNSILDTNFFTPYLLGYLLIIALSKLLPLIVAVKLALSAAVIAFPLSCSALRHESGGNKYWDWLCIPAAYGFSFHWGFLNFVVGAPVAILYLTLCLRHIRSASRMTTVGLFLGSILLFLCHVMLFAVFCGMGVALMVGLGRTWRDRIMGLVPIVLSFPPVLLWVILAANGQTFLSSGVNWVLSLERLLWLPARSFGWPTDVDRVLLALFAMATPMLVAGGIILDWRKLLPFVLFLGCYLLLPEGAFGASFVYERFAMFAIPLYLTTLRPCSDALKSGAATIRAKVVAIAGLLVAASVALTNTVQYGLQYRAFSSESTAFTRILARMEPEKRVLSLVFDANSRPVQTAYLHYPLWYQALKGGLVDVNFGTYEHMLVRYRPGNKPATRIGFEMHPETFDWSHNRGWGYDYFVVRSQTNRTTELFHDADCAVRLVARDSLWWLYRRDWGQKGEPGACATSHRSFEDSLVFSNLRRSADFDTSIDQFGDVHVDVTHPKDDPMAEWLPVPIPDSSQLELNLTASRGATDYKTTYVYAEVNAGISPGMANLLLGSDDGLTVWQDGKMVSKNVVLRPAKLGDDKVRLSLHAGINQLLFRVNNASGGWYLLARID